MIPELIILGGEEYQVDICNAYNYAKLRIAVDKERNPSIILSHPLGSTDISKNCKFMNVVDYISSRKIQREIHIGVGKETLYGVYKTKSDRVQELQYLKKVCSILTIPFTYNEQKDDMQSTHEKAMNMR